MQKLVRLLSISILVYSSIAVADAQPPTPQNIEARLARIERLFNPNAVLEQESRFSQLQSEVQNLRGEIEVLTHNLEQVKKQQQDIFLDIDQRLRQLQQGMNPTANLDESTPISTDATLPESTSTSVAAKETQEPKSVKESATQPTKEAVTSKEPKEVTTSAPKTSPKPTDTSKPVPSTQDDKKFTTPKSTATPKPEGTEGTKKETVQSVPQPTTPIDEPMILATNEEQAFQQTFKLLQQGEYEQAAKGLKQISQQYPQGKYADKTLFWLGEANFELKKFNVALTHFNTLLENYPTSAKRADTLLKIGYIYYELNDRAKARSILERVRDNYAGTATARLAEERLQKMQRESLTAPQR